MRISNNSYTTQHFFRYCLNYTLLSSLSPKTLNPNIYSPLLPNSLSSISCLCKSSSGFLPIKNRFQINSSSGLSPISKIESNSRRKIQSLCYFQSVRPSKNSSLAHSVSHSSDSLALLKHKSHYGCSNRCFTSNGAFTSGPVVANDCFDQQKLEKRNKFPRKFVLEIVDILRNNGAELESRLSMLHSELSIYSITEIFEVLNSRKISGLGLFEWIWINKPQLHKNSHICSLIIDNFGRLDDYEAMLVWLKKFSSEKICLTYEAFSFLLVLSSDDSSMRESSRRVVDLLNKVGGSSRSSGVCALVEIFCKFNLFEMARYIIIITESKSSYYCILIREKCRSGLIEDAHSIIREMGKGNSRCAPNTTVYNYLLGSLLKNGRMDKAPALLDEMKEIGIFRNEITFEILINFVCRSGEIDEVYQLLDEMTSQGIEPRLSTHACIVKTLFAAEKYEAAHKHVVDSRYKTSSNVMYSLMANLYWEKSDIMSAKNVLVEMMEKGLKPNFSTYVKIVKRLRRIGSTDLVRDLESLHSKFVINYRA